MRLASSIVSAVVTAVLAVGLAVGFAVSGPVAFASPAAEAAAEADQRMAVVATTTLVGDIVSQIGGERISLYVMLPPGADPHVFQATPRDARQVADAEVVFANGAGLEADFLGDLITSAAPRRVVELSAHLPLRRLGADPPRQPAEHAGHDANGHDHGGFDPHVWMDPTLVAGWAVAAARVLSELDPEHAGGYTRRGGKLTRALQELDEWARDQVAAIPPQRRILVTDHDMFGYFADRYGFVLLDSIIPGFSTAAEPSARHLAELREAIAEHGIPAIFVGTTVNPHAARAVADDLNIQVVGVYTGSLSAADGPAATYQAFISTNVERIVSALAGSD